MLFNRQNPAIALLISFMFFSMSLLSSFCAFCAPFGNVPNSFNISVKP